MSVDLRVDIGSHSIDISQQQDLIASQNKPQTISSTFPECLENVISKLEAIFKGVLDSHFIKIIVMATICTFTATQALARGYNLVYIAPCALCVGLLATGLYVYMNFREICQEASLLLSLFRKHVLGQAWYNTIIAGKLILSALPLEGSQEEFAKENVLAVLSVVEPWELEITVLGLTPIGDWPIGTINHKIISVPDLTPVPLQELHESADFIHEQISSGRKTAVHCKAGVGRSAAAVMSYLIKHGGFQSATGAYSFVTEKRAHAMLSNRQAELLNQLKT
jgi:protein-tyrosine phosphatase